MLQSITVCTQMCDLVSVLPTRASVVYPESLKGIYWQMQLLSESIKLLSTKLE